MQDHLVLGVREQEIARVPAVGHLANMRKLNCENSSFMKTRGLRMHLGIRELLQSDHLENVPMRPDAGPCLPDPEVEVPVVITIELLHAAGSQPVQPCQQLLCLGLITQIVKPCVKDKKIHACST